MICTFYSYKGGVGRSMAMANVADILSRRGAKVLMVDFDLEAPGLEQFFEINHDGVRRHPGLLDLVLSYKQSMSVARSEDAAFRRLEGFICPVYPRLPGGGRLDIMPAGQRQDPDQLARYALNLRTFDWQDFYFNWEGGLFFEWLRRSLVPRPYDLVLVDSRTGVTEMGGICAYQLADVIIMLSAANRQNIEGTRNMLRDFRSTAVEGLRRGRKLDIVIVPARIEQRDPALLEDFFHRFDEEFGELLPDTLRRAGLDFRTLTIPYEPRFAFEERIVSDPALAPTRERIEDAFGALAHAVALLALPDQALKAAATAAKPAPLQYDAARSFAGYDAYLDSSSQDRESANAMAEGLRARSLRVFVDREDMAPGANWQSVVEEALFHCRILLFCIGASGLTELRRRTLGAALRARERRPEFVIVPVLLPGSAPEMLADTPLVDSMALDFRAGLEGEAIDRLQRAIEQTRSSATPSEGETRSPFSGARPFLESDSDLFFGREAVIERLRGLVLETRVVSVVGPSGCGKSSLVQAGLVPALRRTSPSGDTWTVVDVRLGAEPLADLLQGLQEGVPSKGASSGGGVDGPRDRDLAHALRTAADRAAPARLFVFLDQLEEIFITSRPEVCAEFTDALATALPGLPESVFVVLALRSSFLDALRGLDRLWARLEKGLFEVPLLTTEELKRAIEEPVERVGAAFEPGLVDRIVDDMRGEPGALPLLQVLLVRLWRERREGWLTNDAYARVGGIRGVLATQAAESYAALGPEEQAALRRSMLRLVRIGRSQKEDARCRRAFEELLPAGATLDNHAGKPYVAAGKALIDAGLLVSSYEDGRRVVEPAHESLIHAWRDLVGWLDEDRAFLLWREQLGTQAAAWREKGEPADLLLRGVALAGAQTWLAERGGDLNADEEALVQASAEARKAELAQRDRRRRLAFVFLGTAAAVFFVLALVAFQVMRQAQKDRRAAEEAQAVARAETDRAMNAQEEAQKQRTVAEQNASEAAKQRSLAERQREEALRNAAIAVEQRAKAERHRREAEAQRAEAEAARADAVRQREEAVRQRDEAIRQQKRADEEQQRADAESSRAVRQESIARMAQEVVQSQQSALGGLLSALRPSVVAVFSGNEQSLAVGTGFFVSASGLVVTAGHVAQGAVVGGMRVKAASSKVIEAELVRIDEKRDLALLRVRALDQVVPLALSELPVKNGSTVVALGMAEGREWLPVSGNVLKAGSGEEDLKGALTERDDLITVKLGARAGFSGAPVVDLNRRVIGIVAYSRSPDHDDHVLIPALRIRAAFGKDIAADGFLPAAAKKK